MKRFFTFFEFVLCAIALLTLAASFILPHLFEMRLEKNEQVAQMTLKQIISPALENYAKDNNGTYPASESLLVKGNPPYLKRLYNGKVIQGFVYSLDLSNVGYNVLTHPYRCGIKGSGRKSYAITTGAVFNETDCNLSGGK